MKKGFTLIELVVVIGIMLAVAVVAFTNLGERKTDGDLVAATQQAVTLLRQAQNDAMAQEGDAAWGVYFANTTGTTPSYGLFSNASPAGTTTVQSYLLPTTVAYRTSTVASGATLYITFSSVSGIASASTSVSFYMPNVSAAFSSTISIASSGTVSY